MSSSSSRRRKTASMSNVMFTNAVYFPNFKIYGGATPGMMNYSCVNHVFYAFANVAADGSVFLSDEWADTQAPCDGVQGGLGSLMHLKQKHPHLQVTLSIGGGPSNENFPIVASDTLLRDNFARSARGLVEASGLDGIDINWQYPMDPQQGANFVALLAAVRIHLPEEQFFVTAGLPATRVTLQNIDIAQAAAYLDFINLVAYDFCGPWTPRSGHQAQLYPLNKDEASGSSGVTYLVGHGCPSRKILLGIPLYGRSFLGVTGPGHRHKGAGGEDGAFEYNSLPRRNAKETVDKRIGAASCVGGDGGFVTYDNPETVKMKAAYCRQKGLGGLFYWSGPADSREKSRSLIAAGFRALHSS
ncbi:glycoside hydrolase family 18 protein [Annulohypoxylon truncatum]|uniref:glycoside hydrolase family 18 protein n=1 Tax=Annulohypoxylon truncatum TaxID=327061 RepID=UPI002007D45D|nr:glycoside hydrolase family 18 protein [Annulohypoxylon truncatum]KAI1207060.1 glycoside hydrolase family 18 protein [Annulohypoxylon truncatum]